MATPRLICYAEGDEAHTLVATVVNAMVTVLNYVLLRKVEEAYVDDEACR